MKFGLHYQLSLSASQSAVQRYRDTIEQAVHAEELGFESIWPVEQHFITDLSILPAPLLLLAAISERTKSLRLGIAIVLLPLAHPLRVAEEIGTLDVLSNGRVEFGIGRGALPAHFSGFGVPQSESRDRFLEGLEIILAAWANDRVSFRGHFFQIENLQVVPKPVQQPHPPIRVASNSIDTFELMGRLGYPIFAASQVNPYHRIKEFLAVYHDARAAAGHPNSNGDDFTLLTPLYVAPTEAEIRQDMEPSVRHLLQTASLLLASAPVPEKAAAHLQEVAQRARRLTYDRMSETMAIFDTPDRCVERLSKLREEFKMGRTICWFNPGGLVPHTRVMASMDLFASKVMPHFRGE
jgi:alkanesulfonate monooxygenase SsuD/methylene tetrahydromethanopterin reductase-like flavin-dependent oxidoreductase (luciferase family)